MVFLRLWTVWKLESMKIKTFSFFLIKLFCLVILALESSRKFLTRDGDESCHKRSGYKSLWNPHGATQSIMTPRDERLVLLLGYLEREIADIKTSYLNSHADHHNGVNVSQLPNMEMFGHMPPQQAGNVVQHQPTAQQQQQQHPDMFTIRAGAVNTGKKSSKAKKNDSQAGQSFQLSDI